jgi:hypothetical protein
MAWVQTAYDALWGEDPNKTLTTAELDKANCAELMAVLDESLEIIRAHPFSLTDWVKYKYELIKADEVWGVSMFTYAPILAAKPWPYVDVNRALFDDLDEGVRRRAIFVVWMTLENATFDVKLASIWDVVLFVEA